MWCPGLLDTGLLINEDVDAQWCDGSVVKIKCIMELCPGQQARVDV
jgi:hypothetical protein